MDWSTYVINKGFGDFARHQSFLPALSVCYSLGLGDFLGLGWFNHRLCLLLVLVLDSGSLLMLVLSSSCFHSIFSRILSHVFAHVLVVVFAHVFVVVLAHVLIVVFVLVFAHVFAVVFAHVLIVVLVRILVLVFVRVLV